MSERRTITVTATVECPLTPMHINSKFKTIAEWLSSIANEKKPGTTISEFNINLSLRQPRNEYIVCLYGVNTSLDEKHQTYTHIDFRPLNMYFKFPKRQYKDFTYEQIKDELIDQIKEFILTDEFKNSFLSLANIKFNFDTKPIWIFLPAGFS